MQDPDPTEDKHLAVSDGTPAAILEFEDNSVTMLHTQQSVHALDTEQGDQHILWFNTIGYDTDVEIGDFHPLAFESTEGYPGYSHHGEFIHSHVQEKVLVLPRLTLVSSSAQS